MPLAYVDFVDLYNFTRSSDAQYQNADGAIATVGNDIPATVWVSGLQSGIILEGEATQVIANTSDPDGVMANPFGGANTADSIAAPDGTTTAAKFTEDSSNGSHYIGRNAGFGVSASALSNFSFFVKPNGRTKFQVQLFNFAALTNWIRTTVDVVALTAVGAAGGNGSLVLAPAPQALPGGWYRITIIGIPDVGGSGTMYPRISSLNDAGAGNYLGDGVSGFYHWGYNTTGASDVRSFIATTTAPKTRGADLLSLDSLVTTFASTQGTFYGKFIIPGAAAAAANRTIFHADDGTTDNSYDLRIDAGTLTLRMVVRAGGVEVANLVAGTVTAGSTNTWAFSYIDSAFRLSLNGAAAAQDTSGAVPSGITAIYCGASDAIGSNPLNGIWRRFRRRKAAMSAADLALESAA